MIYWETEVIEVGSMAKQFLSEKMLIIFGDEAPEDLRNYCFIIKNHNLIRDIVVGDKVIISNQILTVTAVGTSVNKNIKNLGHATIKFDGSSQAELPGTLHLQIADDIELSLGTEIVFRSEK